MQTLRQLIQIITPKQLSQQFVISAQTSAQTKLSKLYKGIASSSFRVDEVAWKKLYKSTSSSKANYRVLKHDLRRRLFNNILLYEFPKKDAEEYHKKKMFFECQKTYTIGYFLILLNARNIALPLLREKLPLMERYEFTTLVVETLKLIRQHTAIVEGDFEETQKCNGTLEKWLKIQLSETKVDGFYYLLMANFSRKKADKKFIYTLAHSYYNEVQYAVSSASSSSIIFKSRMIEIIMHKCANDLASAIQICKTTIEELKARPFPNRSSLFTIYIQWINSLLQLHQVGEIQQVCDEMMRYTSEGGFNWFIGKKIAYQAAVYAKDYKAAADIYLHVLVHQEELKRYELLEEDWKIIAISLGILVKAKKISPAKAEQLSNIRIGKIVNDISLATQDKQGKYATINLFQLVNLVLNQRYEQAEKYAAAFKQYKQRYLNSPEYERTHLFVRMVTQLFKVQSNPDTFRKWFDEKLEELSYCSADNKSMELIPYEQLWSFIFERTGNNHFSTMPANSN